MNGGHFLLEYVSMKNNGKHAEAKEYLESLSLDELSDINAYVQALDFYLQKLAYAKIVGGDNI